MHANLPTIGNNDFLHLFMGEKEENEGEASFAS